MNTRWMRAPKRPRSTAVRRTPQRASVRNATVRQAPHGCKGLNDSFKGDHRCCPRRRIQHRLPFQLHLVRWPEAVLADLASHGLCVAVHQIMHPMHHGFPPRRIVVRMRMAHRAARALRCDVLVGQRRVGLHEQHHAEQELTDEALKGHRSECKACARRLLPQSRQKPLPLTTSGAPLG